MGSNTIWVPHLGGIPRRMVIEFAKLVTSYLNYTQVHNATTLLYLIKSRPPGTPLITVNNHMSMAQNIVQQPSSYSLSNRDQNATIQGYQLIDWRNASFGSNNTSSRSSYSMQTPQNFSYRSTNLGALQQQSSTYRSNPISSDSRFLMPLTSRASPVRIRSTVPVFSAPPRPRRIRPEDAPQTMASIFVVPSLIPAPDVCIRFVIPVCSAPGCPPCD